MAFKGEKTVFKMNRTIFLKLKHSYTYTQATILNKKLERLRDSYSVFWAKFVQKINFFQIFLHFQNQLDELIGKMVLFFQFDEFWFWAFLALTTQNATFPYEAINVQKCLRISY